jgi:hypothetical protein
MPRIGLFGKRTSEATPSARRADAPLKKRAGSKVAAMLQKLGLIHGKVAATPKHPLCIELIRKKVDPRAVMRELLKLRKSAEDAIDVKLKALLQDLSRSEIEKIHRSVVNNKEPILSAIKELHEILAHDTTGSDQFTKAISDIHMDLIAMCDEVENRLIQQTGKARGIGPKIDNDKKELIVGSLKAAWRDLMDDPSQPPKSLLELRLSQPVPTRTHHLPHARPKASAPLTRPRKGGFARDSRVRDASALS